MILAPESLSDLSAAQLRELLDRIMGDLRHKQALIDKLTHENAMLKRLKFAAQSEGMRLKSDTPSFRLAAPEPIQ